MEPVHVLLDKGVVIPCPGSVEIGNDVVPDFIAPGVIIHTGCKILGKDTSIGPGCEIGFEVPATIENCQLGSEVHLKGGSFSGATFLDRSSMGSGAHVRAGTLLEEEASGAHGVGFKQTILFPFVTAGSLINFCDVLMAGGISRTDHSEIGSSYIHFNFTPHGDKATASLIGNVSQGVMLDQSAIFLGGQAGLVGPARIAFGTLLPAGFICREDVENPGQMIVPKPGLTPGDSKTLQRGVYRSIDRIVLNNLHYLGNIKALKQWYIHIRQDFLSRNSFSQACYGGALKRLDEAILERVKRLKELAEKMPESIRRAKTERKDSFPEHIKRQQYFMDWFYEAEAALLATCPESVGEVGRDEFFGKWEHVNRSDDYIDSIHALPEPTKEKGRIWLQAVVNEVVNSYEES
ncbi:MAG: UDP-N-acetylglucosamine pyrophosphorylase [Kiritimatiellae bacterium]|nr:UDP-N-acetylglucosamine pyrophosphorylase [Kiritimatiellia bacterium]